jgi:hypothetical protein
MTAVEAHPSTPENSAPNAGTTGRRTGSCVNPQAVDTKLMDQVLSMNLQYHVDRTGEPCLLIPSGNSIRAYPIQSKRVRAYIATSAWNSARLLFGTGELTRVLRVLEGLAWESIPQDATTDQLWRSLEDKPVLQVVIEFMREREKYETQMQSFLKDLEEVALRHRFDMYSKKWPKTPAHLSAQLRQEHNQGILEQFGVAVEISRDRNGAKLVLRRATPRLPSDGEEAHASPAASLDNSQSAKALTICDARDDETLRRQLENRILDRQKQNVTHVAMMEKQS